MNPDKEFREAAMKVIKQYEELMENRKQKILLLEGRIEELEGQIDG